MANQKNEFILKEAHKIILISLAIGLIIDFFISDFLSNIIYVFIFILLFIYRNPNRNNYIKNEEDVIAPIDGKIISIDKTKNKQKIYIDVGLCNTHMLKAPISSKYKFKLLKKGLNLNKETFKAKKLNSQAVLKFDDIKLKLISGICNTSLKFIKSKNILQNENIGIFIEGLIILELSNDYKVNIKLNEKIYSTNTIIATKVHN